MLNMSATNPSLIKYMGSKSEIMDFVIDGLNVIHKPGQAVCDLFSGSCTLACALRGNDIAIYSNDIQAYSEVLANTYLGNYRWSNYPEITQIINEVAQMVDDWKTEFPDLWEKYDYNKDFSLEQFTAIEKEQSDLINCKDFIKSLKFNTNENIRNYHLFTLDYSGTYWGFHQCVWIDSLRCVIDRYKNIPEYYNLLLSCTMFAMAYNSQSTGHYAQFRKAHTELSMNDILTYRRKTMDGFIRRKYDELRTTLTTAPQHFVTKLDYIDCIDQLPENTLVYADPPYCFVHYSRFYHILETFVLYDYPIVKYEGRYRDDRHQSPFCIATKVESAFLAMFEHLLSRNCSMVLSYSNSDTNMIELPQLLIDAYAVFNSISKSECQQYYNQIKQAIQEFVLENVNNDQGSLDINKFYRSYIHSAAASYQITLQLFPHVHSRMGRTQKKNINVFEALILAYRS